MRWMLRMQGCAVVDETGETSVLMPNLERGLDGEGLTTTGCDSRDAA